MSYQLHEFIGGKIYLDVDESPMMRARVERRYEPFKTAMLLRLLAPGMTYVDVGANKGYFALLAAKHLNGTGQVLAFEPEPSNCHCIQQSLQANGYTKVKILEVALSDCNERGSLYLGEKSGWHTLLPDLPQRGKGTIEVEQRRLDTVLNEFGTGRVDVIKIDVEGAELRVLAGARDALMRNKRLVLLMDLHPYLGTSPVEVCRFLRDLGFSLFDMRLPQTPVVASELLTVLYAERINASAV